jgi:hypothetical protein
MVYALFSAAGVCDCCYNCCYSLPHPAHIYHQQVYCGKFNEWVGIMMKCPDFDYGDED